MLKERDPQESVFNSDSQFLNFVGRDTFYGFLAEHRHQIFHDKDFASLYCLDNGRGAVAPSTLAVALLLQTYDKVADAEATRRARYDLQWLVALGVELGTKPFAKSTLQLFRAKLILHEQAQRVFLQSLEYARTLGFLQSKKITICTDTTPIFGKGAVKDTYNLLVDGIVALVHVLAELDTTPIDVWAEHHDLRRYLAPSIKGTTTLDWDDEQQRSIFLRGIVADADRLLLAARTMRSRFVEESPEDVAIVRAADLLSQLLVQDVRRSETNDITLKQGVAKDRIIAVHDTEMRHGRKSARQRFDGHKAALAADSETQLITAVAVLPGNAHDHTDVMQLVTSTEEHTNTEVEATIGDCAYGDGATRQSFHDAGRTLIAKSPRLPHNSGRFTKIDFVVDVDANTVTCPNGVVVSSWRTGSRSPSGHHYKVFPFPTAVCRSCPLAAQCVKHPGKDARTIGVHPQERLLREARHFQQTPEFATRYRLRQVAEHRIARIIQLGMRHARYVGRTKTLFQLLMAAAVANLTLIASRVASGTSFFICWWLTRLLFSLLCPQGYVTDVFRAQLKNNMPHHVPISLRYSKNGGFRPCF
jgi:transposase